MASGFYGADVAELRALAIDFDRRAEELAASIATVTQGVQGSAWFGPIAVQFRMTWTRQHSVNLSRVKDVLHEQAIVLRRQAQEQEEASKPASRQSGSQTGVSNASRDYLARQPRNGDIGWQDSAAKANPHHRDLLDWISQKTSGTGGYYNNCGSCALAYEMRRRGYDVTAAYEMHSTHSDLLKRSFTVRDTGLQPVWRKDVSVDQIAEDFKVNGPWTRGIVYVSWGNGHGHFYNVENIDGTVHFINPQDGDTNFDVYKAGTPQGFMYMRVDDLDIEAFMGQMVLTENR